jgi:hypothetical protein
MQILSGTEVALLVKERVQLNVHSSLQGPLWCRACRRVGGQRQRQ